MVKRIIGIDEKGKEVFNREARVYDENIANRTFGITISDIFKVIPIFVLLITVYVNQQNFNYQVLRMTEANTQAISGMRTVLENLNNYLSSTTGKQFRDGSPR